MKKKHVFITGANGFIGANIVRKLTLKGYNVHVLNRSPNISWRLKNIAKSVTVHQGDITNLKSLEKILLKSKPDFIVHLAAYGAYPHQTDIKKIFEVNTVGIINLLEASKKIPYKCLINAGSSSEYGSKDKAMKEDNSCNPISYYAATKLASTNICKIFADINNKPIVTFRLFSAYGPYEEPSRFIPTIIKSLIKKEKINITPGNQRRDFIYVEDISNAFLKALTLGKKIQGEIINLGTGKEYTNDEIVKKLFYLTNKKTAINKGEYPKRSWDVPHWKADMSKAKKILNLEPQYDIDNGLLDTYFWIKNNIKFYN